MIYIFLIVIIVETLLFFFKILPKSALRRHLKKRKKIYVGPRFHFEDIANIILDTLGIMKITMEFWYGGGARGPMLAPLLEGGSFHTCYKFAWRECRYDKLDGSFP